MPNSQSEGVGHACCGERREAILAQMEAAVAHERELREAATSERDRALQQQALEYERRLTDLNHNLRQLIARDQTYLSKDRFDEYTRLTAILIGTHTNQITTIYTWGAAGLLFLAILEFAIRMVWK